MTTSTQTRDEIFPGYQLTDRLGSGGYAEVWRARAPGGIEKAVKIVYGYYDEQLASQEMKAMERVKDVRHPFVLSLERFEVVDGRLAILTELADMSLDQRAQQCRAEGLPGIPRDELLRYMADAAEALDYLAQRHSLQHLDVKPANLLISGEHIKVADFGLVKELVSRTQNSMVAGMTPTYSSPEMFDDSPSPHSDQYSLAIVYQEMLTGVLPFPGKTAAQLASQHLQAAPQLAALPEIDRPVVGKALSKAPQDRYPSCRAFVKSLIDASSRLVGPAVELPDVSVRPQTNVTSPPPCESTLPRVSATPHSPVDSCDHALQQTELNVQGTIDTQSDRPPASCFRMDRTIVDVAVPGLESAPIIQQPTLYIAAGGFGIHVLNRFRELLFGGSEKADRPTGVEMIAIDTDRLEIKEACSSRWASPLAAEDVLNVPLRLPQEYRESGRDNLEWLSHRWLYNIPRSLETRGYRPLGRLAVVDHVDKVASLLDRKLKQLVAAVSDPKPEEPIEVRVVILAGMGGGTGSGIVIDLANAARSRIEALGHRAVLEGVLVCTSLGNVSASPLSVANTYALLTELQYASEFGNRSSSESVQRCGVLESSRPPFDHVYCIPAKQRSGEGAEDAASSIAKQLYLAASDGAREALALCRKTGTPRELNRVEPLLLRSFGSSTLSGPKQHRVELMAKRLLSALEQYWLTEAGISEWSRLTRREPEPALRPAAEGSTEESNVDKPTSPHSLAERLREEFTEQTSSRFAFEIVSRVIRQSTLRDAYRAGLQASNDPGKVAGIAARLISLIAARRNASADAQPQPGDDESMTKSILSTSNRVLIKLLDAIGGASAAASDANKLDQLIKQECVAIATEHLGQQSGDRAAGLSPDLEAGLRQALDNAGIDLLQCGHDRRTLVLVPRTNSESSLVRDVATIRGESAAVPADIDEAVLFCEGSGISSTAFQQSLQRVYPDIAEAASRFFTRIDINWRARST